MSDEPEIDLAGYEYMPLLGDKLFSSDFYAEATAEEFRAALTLWWAAWRQVPAGTLPNNDVVLASLAGYGRDVKAWLDVKPMALHGFAGAGDGRLRHTLLCQQAKIAFEKRVTTKKRVAQWREAKKQKAEEAHKQRAQGDVTRYTTVTEPLRNAYVTSDVTGRNVTVRSTSSKLCSTNASKAIGGKNAKSAFSLPDPLVSDNQPSAPKRKPSKTRLPESFAVSDDVRAWAASKGFDRVDDHFSAFCDTARAKGYEYIDWDAALRNAISKDWAKLRILGQGRVQTGQATRQDALEAHNRQVALEWASHGERSEREVRSDE
jgi:hypothetical protein